MADEGLTRPRWCGMERQSRVPSGGLELGALQVPSAGAWQQQMHVWAVRVATHADVA